MPTKDPITVIGVLATAMLVAGGAMLYLIPTQPLAQKTVFTSPFKKPAPTPPKEALKQAPPVAPTPPPAALLSSLISSLPVPSLVPKLTEKDLAKLTPAERTRYETTRKSLENVLQQVQTLEQENTRLQQTLEQGNAKIQALDAAINKLRPAKPTNIPPPPPPTPTPP